MKELNNIRKLANQEIVSTKEAPTEKVFLGSLRPNQGHTLFEINILTGDIKKAEFEQEAIKWSDAVNLGKVSMHRKCVVKENCVYISALNEKNALKKYKKSL